MSSDILELVKTEYLAGQLAFERGLYRQSVGHLEKARGLVERNSGLGGEVQIWLVTAYEAADQRSEAIALCNLLTNHPDLDTRKQARRLLSILSAPKLRTRPEWLSKIPDLAALEESDAKDRRGSSAGAKRAATARQSEEEPVDLSQVNTTDNRFIWLGLAVAVLTVIGLLFFV